MSGGHAALADLVELGRQAMLEGRHVGARRHDTSDVRLEAAHAASAQGHGQGGLHEGSGRSKSDGADALVASTNKLIATLLELRNGTWADTHALKVALLRSIETFVADMGRMR